MPYSNPVNPIELYLKDTLAAWGTPQFEQRLKEELLSHGEPLLSQMVSPQQGGIVDPQSVALILLSSTPQEGTVQVRLQILFNEVIGGCSCGDPPVEALGSDIVTLTIDCDSARSQIVPDSD